jgi:hypothetical protein
LSVFWILIWFKWVHFIAIDSSRKKELDFRSSDLGHITKGRITVKSRFFHAQYSWRSSFVLRLDYLSCVLTITSTILVGRRCWEGWALAGVNSVLICIIGLRTEQLGFIPANVFCMVMSAINLRAWRRPGTS